MAQGTIFTGWGSLANGVRRTALIGGTALFLCGGLAAGRADASSRITPLQVLQSMHLPSGWHAPVGVGGGGPYLSRTVACPTIAQGFSQHDQPPEDFVAQVQECASTKLARQLFSRDKALLPSGPHQVLPGLRVGAHHFAWLEPRGQASVHLLFQRYAFVAYLLVYNPTRLSYDEKLLHQLAHEMNHRIILGGY